MRLGGIGVVLGAALLSFAYVGGWLSPHRLTATRLVDRFERINGVQPGFRRNHAKGVCISGYFDSNGSGAGLSRAVVFKPGRTPVIGRFALAGGLPFQADGPKTVRSMALSFRPAAAQEWRTGMNDMPVFAVSTPQAFYEQLLAARPDLPPRERITCTRRLGDHGITPARVARPERGQIGRASCRERVWTVV